jgi:hypothetical protein
VRFSKAFIASPASSFSRCAEVMSF